MEYFLLFFILVLVSGFFSGAESALFSLDETKRESMRRESKGSRAVKVNRILKWLLKPEKTLSAILFGNLAVNILISETGHSVLEQLLGRDYPNLPLISLLAITALLLIFAEILPKVSAIQVAESWSIVTSPLLRVWFTLSTLFHWPVYRITRLITEKIPSQSTPLNRKELTEALHLAEEHGFLSEDEKFSLHRSVSFYHDSAYACMIPKSEIFMIPHNVTPAKARSLFREGRHSVALVFNGTENRITGSLHVRSLMQALFKKQKSVRNRIMPLPFLPETMPAIEVLSFFASNHIEIAGLVDEAGDFSGIITIKSILKKIMGEWVDELHETHRDKGQITRLSNGNYRVNGAATIDELNEFFSINLEAENSETIAGLLIEMLDGFPHQSTRLQYQGVCFSNMQMEDNRIKSVDININV